MKKLNSLGANLKKVRYEAMMLMTSFFIFLNSKAVQAKTTAESGTAKANAIAESSLGTGLKNMFNDASAYLLVLSPIIGGLFAIYFLIRKNAADEQDQKQWNKRLIVTGVCVVGAVLVSGTINVITGYFTTKA